MNMGNLILIVLAILLLWGAINLDRTSQRRVVEDQSAQLNDSIEILRKSRASLQARQATTVESLHTVKL